MLKNTKEQKTSVNGYLMPYLALYFSNKACCSLYKLTGFPFIKAMITLLVFMSKMSPSETIMEAFL